jgi:hypothetical protein
LFVFDVHLAFQAWQVLAINVVLVDTLEFAMAFALASATGDLGVGRASG